MVIVSPLPAAALEAEEALGAPPLESYLVGSAPYQGQTDFPHTQAPVFVFDMASTGGEVTADEFEVIVTDDQGQHLDGLIELSSSGHQPGTSVLRYVHWISENGLDPNRQYTIECKHPEVWQRISISFQTGTSDAEIEPRVVAIEQTHLRFNYQEAVSCHGQALLSEPTCAEVTLDELRVTAVTTALVNPEHPGGQHTFILSQASTVQEAEENAPEPRLDITIGSPRVRLPSFAHETWSSNEVCAILVVMNSDGETVIEDTRCTPIDWSLALRELNDRRQTQIDRWLELNPLEGPDLEEGSEINLSSGGCDVANTQPASPFPWLLCLGVMLFRRRRTVG